MTRSGSIGQQEFPDIEVFELGWWLHSTNNRRRFMWRVVAYKEVLSTVAARLVRRKHLLVLHHVPRGISLAHLCT